MRLLFVTLLCLSFTYFSNAQSLQGSIQGTVIDSTGQPLSRASIKLVHAKDTTLAYSKLTSDKGFFQISGIDSGAYLMYISYLGYLPLIQAIDVSNKKSQYDFNKIKLSNTSISLKGITIAESYEQLRISGDTLDYNANAFKTKKNAVVEDLLKKIPGITIDPDGTIKSGGKEIQKILVDGKPFFGDDPKIAMKNLPSDIIERVQVYKKKSDQAEFTGVDDGNSKKVINLKIKEDKKKGVFGEASAGGGTEDRYATHLNLFRFNGDRQISLIGSGNNINRRNYSYKGKTWSRNAGSGELKSWSGGVNYRDKWGKKVDVSGNYFINYNDRNSIRDENTQYILPDTSYFKNQNQVSRNKSVNHRFRMRIDYQIDSLNSILFRPSMSYNKGDYYSTSNFNTKDLDSNQINKGSRNYSSHSESPNFSGSLLYRHRFLKKGRTFSLRLNGGLNDNDSYGSNNQQNTLYDKSESEEENIDQHYIQNNDSRNWGTRITYTEPLSDTRKLELHVGHSANTNLSKKDTYNKDPLTGEYTVIDTVFSNNFKTNYQSNEAGFNIQTKKEKYKYTIGLNVENNNLENYSISGDSSLSQNTVNYFPSLRFDYDLTDNRSLRFRYRGNSGQPSIQQLQPVNDNSQSLRVLKGNPDLKPYFTHSLRFEYRYFDRETHHMLFADISARTTMNEIVNSTIYGDGGKQTIQYENTDGNYSLSGRINIGRPLSEDKNYNSIHSNTSINYRQNSSFINNNKNFSKRLTLAERISLNFSIEDLLNLRVSGNVRYNKTSYSLQESQNTSYFNYGGMLDFNLDLPANIELQTDLRYTGNSGLSAGFNQNIMDWNASISKYLFNNQSGEIKLSAYDLLQQRSNIDRQITSQYISDVRTNELPAYFLLSFVYHIKYFPGGGGGQAPDDHHRPRRRYF